MCNHMFLVLIARLILPYTVQTSTDGTRAPELTHQHVKEAIGVCDFVLPTLQQVGERKLGKVSVGS